MTVSKEISLVIMVIIDLLAFPLLCCIWSSFYFKVQHITDCYRADLGKVPFLCGHLVMEVEIMIIATVMVTQIPSGLYPSVVPQKMVTFPGTQRRAAQLWQLHTAVGLLERNRFVVSWDNHTYNKFHSYMVCDMTDKDLQEKVILCVWSVY